MTVTGPLAGTRGKDNPIRYRGYYWDAAFANGLPSGAASLGPEVHGVGRYGHYHDITHTFHIWYGGTQRAAYGQHMF